MGATAAIAITAFGTGMSAIGQVKAGNAQQRIGDLNSQTILQTSEENATLIEQGSELNAQSHDFNASALDKQAADAVAIGQEQENLFRTQIEGVIGSQRTSYAGQNVDVNDGSAGEVQQDTAKQSELDALTIRLNAQREAWGYSQQATSERMQAASTRTLGALQVKNTRAVGQAQSMNAALGGDYASSAANWGAASTIVGGSGNILAKKYGF